MASDDKNSLRVTRQWDVYGWAAVSILFLLFILADLVNLDALQPFLMIPAAVLFVILVGPFIVRGRP